MPAVNNAALRRQAQNQPGWFLGAPISKVLCILWAMGSLWIIRSDDLDEENYDRRHYGDYDSNSWGSAIFHGPSGWVFQSTTELIIGMSFLAYYLRRIEQQLSSRRLVAWLIFLEVVSVFVRLIAVGTMDDEVAGVLVGPASVKGPYLVVGGILYWYKACVPRLYPRFLSSTTLGISCSEKTIPYVWALYVLYMREFSSLLMGVVGVFASAIYFFLLSVSTKSSRTTSNIPLLDIPDAVVNLLPWETLGSVFFVDPTPRIYAPFLTLRAAMNIRNGGGGEDRPRRHRGDQRVPPVPEAPVAMPVTVPSPEAVTQLTSMGFEEDRVKEALQASDNNIERAANILLMGS
mmetsp:Transcript_29414/g.69152  ORF Transcript_29414/g.69152 Transcript_29414/m.69152 type:complete len:347 (+) Transcript_29414:253-1293(+)